MREIGEGIEKGHAIMMEREIPDTHSLRRPFVDSTPLYYIVDANVSLRNASRDNSVHSSYALASSLRLAGLRKTWTRPRGQS